jgi:P27 family predicted phage terminase small subunit
MPATNPNAGRKALPTAIKLAKGNPGKRALNGKEPRVLRVRLVCPRWVSERAAPHWERFAGLAHSMGVLSQIDGTAMESLCEAYADWRDAIKEKADFRASNGNSLTTESLNPAGVTVYKSHPSVAQVTEADRRLRTWLTEFGMTPSARSRVHGNQTEDEKDAAEEDYFGAKH